MRFLTLKTTLNQSLTLIVNNNNGFLRPIAQQSFAIRCITTEEKKQKKELKKAEKLAKKLAAKAAEPPSPDYIKTRNVIYTNLKNKYDEYLAAKPEQSIKITLPDGQIIDGLAFKTTPFAVAQGISGALASETTVAKVNDKLWALERPLEADSEIELLKYDEAEAKATFWLSAACLLGEALERAYGVYADGLLCGIGALDKGFYADVHMKEGTADLATVQERLDKILSIKTKFEYIEASKGDALELFAYNKFQQRLIEATPADRVVVYRSGNAIGVTSQPLLRHGKKIKAFKLLKSETAFWNNQKDAEPVQRVYGIAFPSDVELAEFVRKQGA